MNNSTETIHGTYGSAQTPCEIYVYYCRDGSAWYAVDGSLIANCTWDRDALRDGVDVETLNDCDTLTWSDPITGEMDIVDAVCDAGED